MQSGGGGALHKEVTAGGKHKGDEGGALGMSGEYVQVGHSSQPCDSAPPIPGHLEIAGDVAMLWAAGG